MSSNISNCVTSLKGDELSVQITCPGTNSSVDVETGVAVEKSSSKISNATAGAETSARMLYMNSQHTTQKQLPNFDGYETIKQIGQGTHATCFLSKEISNGEYWAIKVLCFIAKRTCI